MKRIFAMTAAAVMLLAGCKEKEAAFVLPSPGDLVIYRTSGMGLGEAAYMADTLSALGFNAISIESGLIMAGDELERARKQLHEKGIAILGSAPEASSMARCAQCGADGAICGMADSLSIDGWREAVSQARSATASRLMLIADNPSPEMFQAGFDANVSTDFTDSLTAVFCRDSSALKMVIADDEEYAGVPSGKACLRYIPDSVFNAGSGAARAAAAAVMATRGGVIISQGQENDPGVRQILRIHSANPGMHAASTASYSDNEAYILEKASGEEKYLLVLNVRDSTLAIPIPQSWQNTPFTNIVTGKKGRAGGRMPVTPYELRILKK